MSESETEMRVWIGCLACYNAGRLVGEWYPAIEAEDVDTAALHGGESALMRYELKDGGSPHEELWCMDTEYMLTDGEMSPSEATRQAEAMSAISEDDRDAYRFWCKHQGRVVESEGFYDAYAGTWQDWDDYVYQFVDDMGYFQNVPDVPDVLENYFDYDKFGRDLAMDYEVIYVTYDRTHVFRYH